MKLQIQSIHFNYQSNGELKNASAQVEIVSDEMTHPARMRAVIDDYGVGQISAVVHRAILRDMIGISALVNAYLEGDPETVEIPQEMM